jgi:hypothetical protein
MGIPERVRERFDEVGSVDCPVQIQNASALIPPETVDAVRALRVGQSLPDGDDLTREVQVPQIAPNESETDASPRVRSGGCHAESRLAE